MDNNSNNKSFWDDPINVIMLFIGLLGLFGFIFVCGGGAN